MSDEPEKHDLGPGYLKAEDLMRGGDWITPTLTIKEVIEGGTVKAPDGTLIKHPIVVFEKATKQLILGNTNRRLIQTVAMSSLREDWIGKQITLTVCKGDWFGQKDVIAVRVWIWPGTPRPFIKKSDYGTPLKIPKKPA